MSVSKMKRILLILSVLLASCAVSEARKVAPEALGTTRYVVRYKQGAITTKVATAVISLEEGERGGRPVYHSRSTIKSAPVFRLFLGADYVADSWLDRGDLAPLYYATPYTKKGYPGILEYDYDAGERTIRARWVKSAQDSVKTSFPLDARTMDLLSLVHNVRFLDLTASDAPVRMHVLMRDQAASATLTCLGPDPETFPDREADHFLLKLSGRGIMENGSGNEIHLWRSRDRDCRILRLEASLSSGFMFVTVEE